MIDNRLVDTRTFELVHVPYMISLNGKSISLNQRELMLIMKHTKGRNAHIYDKLRKFISEVDRYEGKTTDFDARVPKTHIIHIM